MEHTYPLVIFPEGLKYIADAKPPLPSRPQEPKEPTLHKPQEPKEPTKPDEPMNSLGCGLSIIGFYVLVYYFLKSLSEFNRNHTIDTIAEFFPFNILFFAGPFLGVFLIYGHFKYRDTEKETHYRKLKKYEENKRIYKNKLKKYEYDLANYKLDYQNRMESYQKNEYNDFLSKVSKFEEHKKYLYSHEYLYKYRKKLLNDFFEEATKPSNAENKYLEGASERKIFQFLKGKSKKFYQNLAIIEYEEIEDFYMPDIVYYDKKNELLIDIEIDEPYLTSDGSPIHCIGSDDSRNDFFINHSWIVIRFAEEQVVKYPNQSYRFIKKVIKKVKEVDFSETEFRYRVDMWTKNEAYKMAYNRFRQSYLRSNLSNRFNEETSINKRLDEGFDDTRDLAIEMYEKNITYNDILFDASIVKEDSSIVHEEHDSLSFLQPKTGGGFKLYTYAKKYYDLGLNVTCIHEEENEYNKHTQSKLKHPAHKYIHLHNQKQTILELISYNWTKSVGVGTVSGFNSLTIIDIDGCTNRGFIKFLLKKLSLPKNYEWVTLTGSKKGFHIIIESPKPTNLDENQAVMTYEPAGSVNHLFEKIELLWRTHVVLPPSKHKSNGEYSFVNSFPKSKPRKVDTAKLMSVISTVVEDETKIIGLTYRYNL
ncbi:MAG: bifunctional DNA primase/polymerase [Chitinophagales bacterium]